MISLYDVNKLDDEEEMLSPKNIDLNVELEPRQRNEEIKENMYFETITFIYSALFNSYQ